MKPLHVRVAETLGCQPFLHDDRWYCEPAGCKGGDAVRYPDGSHHAGEYGALLEYDTDWSATGPLIERLGITVGRPDHPALRAADGEWFALHPDHEDGPQEYGPTPLIAVCNLILALKEAGKL